MFDLSKNPIDSNNSHQTTTIKPENNSRSRRQWTGSEVAELVSALATSRTTDIAHALGVNPKALRSLLRRQGISLRGLRCDAKRDKVSEAAGLVVRRPQIGASATYGAAALEALPEKACRWPLGDPAEADFAFCGAATPGRHSYCGAHMRCAYNQDT